ncbi:c-type cytochrome biogenesis protein CcsB [Geodermatophilus sp. Leaf369]|uniref:c-type cytochrome biogenesis protein CcsB n=1 Tax=Geodermatophilus sp. Leaf369 TaxID=1736354 RepID=UPI0007022E3E|nr:c-type cytochrome biogenesis protein CcsB [Geodermatophilus sp. Leaf369]KQS54498.1 c-type cytochrome biogenesis protein CcsB [Geodermatophilus sp. Leaf369]
MSTQTMASLSDQLFTVSVLAYGLATLAFCAQLAFGSRQRATAADAESRSPVLIPAGPRTGPPGQGGSPAGEPPAADPPSADAPFVRPARRFSWSTLALALTVLGAVVQTAVLALRGFGTGRAPWGNMYEFGTAAVLIGVLAYLVTAFRVPAMRHIGLFVTGPVMVSLVLIGFFLYAEAGPLIAALRSDWLVVHVSAAIISFGVFLVSATASVLFLLQRRREGRPPRARMGVLDRLPSSVALDRVAHRAAVFAFPIWTFAVVAGAIWAESAWGRFWGWDPKETWAFISWVAYASYLHARSTAGWRGAPAAWINLVGFGSLVFNLLFVNLVSTGLHSYGGV